MSNARVARDRILSRVGTVLSSHNRLTDPYSLNENNEQALRLGYGVSIGAGSATNRNLSCRFSYSLNFIVTITKVVRANEYDYTSKESAEGDIIDDLHLVRVDLEKDAVLNNSSDIANTRYLSHGGIERVFGDKFSYIYIQGVFDVEYFEDI